MLIHALSPLHWKQESLPSDDVSVDSGITSGADRLQTEFELVPLPPRGETDGAWRRVRGAAPITFTRVLAMRRARGACLAGAKPFTAGMGLIAWGQRKRLSGWVQRFTGAMSSEQPRSHEDERLFRRLRVLALHVLGFLFDLQAGLRGRLPINRQPAAPVVDEVSVRPLDPPPALAPVVRRARRPRRRAASGAPCEARCEAARLQAAAENSRSAWAQLPTELLTKVFELVQAEGGRSGSPTLPGDGLGFCEATAEMRLVCAEWRVVHDAALRRLKLRAKTTDKALTMLTRRFPAVTSMQLKGTWQRSALLTDEGMCAVSRLPNLTALDLQFCFKFTDDGVRAVSALPLKSLHLAWCRELTDDGLAAVSGMRALTHLDLCACAKVTGEGMRAVARLPALRSLQLAGCAEMTDDGVCAVSEIPTLTSLSLAGCDKITDDALCAVSRRRGLTNLNLRDCAKVTEVGLGAVVRLSALTRLNLGWCRNVADEDVIAVSRNLPQLASLCLAGCSKLTDNGIRAVCRLQGLTDLNLRDCWRLTDQSVRSVSELPALKSLDLSCCDLLTDKGLRAMSRVRTLTFLDLSNCHQVVLELPRAVRHMPALATLNLTACYNLADDGVRAVRTMPALTALNLGSCFELTDKALRAVSRMSSLKSLNLVDCAKVTDQGVRTVCALPSLTELSLNDRHNVTDAALRALRGAHAPTLHLDWAAPDDEYVEDAGVAAA